MYRTGKTYATKLTIPTTGNPQTTSVLYSTRPLGTIAEAPKHTTLLPGDTTELMTKNINQTLQATWDVLTTMGIVTGGLVGGLTVLVVATLCGLYVYVKVSLCY
jgi:hypothetical protein